MAAIKMLQSQQKKSPWLILEHQRLTLDTKYDSTELLKEPWMPGQAHTSPGQAPTAPKPVNDSIGTSRAPQPGYEAIKAYPGARQARKKGLVFNLEFCRLQ